MQKSNARTSQAKEAHVSACQLITPNIQKKSRMVAKEEHSVQQNENNIPVYLRVRSTTPLDSIYSIQDGTTLMCRIPEGSNALRNVRDGETVIRKYTFSKVLGPDNTQADIFNSIMKPKMKDFTTGTNGTILMYGGSKSGKTHTFIGTAEEPGLIPRTLEYLFNALPGLSQNKLVKPFVSGNVIKLEESACEEEQQKRNNLLKAVASSSDNAQHIKTYKCMQQKLVEEFESPIEMLTNCFSSIWVSFAEICNEQIYDLLQPTPRGQARSKLQLGSHNGITYIKNLSTVNILSGLEAFQILQYGIHNAAINSSRSHSIFTIKLAQISNNDNTCIVSHLNFCDLLGNERLKKPINAHDKLKESVSANASLVILGRCIRGARNVQKHNDQRMTPFRESKLTQLLQRALSGLENISLVVNMNPSKDLFDETYQVLNFAALTKNIIVDRKGTGSRFDKNSSDDNGQVVRKEANSKSEMERLQNLINQLRNEIEQQKVEYEENERNSRNQIIIGYKEILQEVKDHWETELEVAENNYRTEYDIKLNDVKRHYESLLKETRHTNIINLDDSSEEAEQKNDLQQQLDEYENLLKEQHETISSLQNELLTLKFEVKMENKRLHDEIRNLTGKNKALRDKNNELEKTLRDATDAYKILQKNIEDELKTLLAERIELKEKVTELEDQLLQEMLWKRHETDIEDCY